MNKNFLLIISLLLVFGCSNGQQINPSITKLSATEFSEKIKSIDAPQLVDVRTPEEFEGGHITNAKNINWNGDDFTTQIEKLDKSQPILVYCLSGGRSAAAAKAMKEKGFQVYEMTGGMMAWRATNLPEEKGKQTVQSMTMEQYNHLIDSDKLVLIDFYADWCAPCKKMEPYLKKISEDSQEMVEVIRINADKNSELCKTLNVTSLPVLKLYKNKELVWDNLGFVDESKVREKITKNK